MVLSKTFYKQDTLTVAKSLLGKVLIHNSHLGRISGMIVETEAYLGSLDPASHTHRGETIRTRAMFGEPGHAYIYFTYGMYFCFNVVTAPKGTGEGVLIRALQPIDGIDLMYKNRYKTEPDINLNNNVNKKVINLTNGPAKLVIAMGVTKDHYGVDLIKSDLQIHEGEMINESNIVTTTRIGIKEAADLPYRFYIKNNPFVSVVVK